MALLNVRVDDHILGQLKGLADEAGVTLSEYVRELLLAAVVPVFPSEERHGEEPAPQSMRIFDRQVLSLLHRILGRVLPENSNDVDGDLEYQLERAQILEEGYTGEYWIEVAGFRTELSALDCDRVTDILQMFRIATFSIEHLEKEGEAFDEMFKDSLQFQGFDHNDSLERHMANYVEYQMKDRKWTELKPQLEAADNGNSHSPMLSYYLRMLAEYRRIMDSRDRGHSRYDYLLTRSELEQVVAASVHPSARSRS